jgi:hypothetical protein
MTRGIIPYNTFHPVQMVSPTIYIRLQLDGQEGGEGDNADIYHK